MYERKDSAISIIVYAIPEKSRCKKNHFSYIEIQVSVSLQISLTLAMFLSKPLNHTNLSTLIDERQDTEENLSLKKSTPPPPQKKKRRRESQMTCKSHFSNTMSTIIAQIFKIRQQEDFAQFPPGKNHLEIHFCLLQSGFSAIATHKNENCAKSSCCPILTFYGMNVLIAFEKWL